MPKDLHSPSYNLIQNKMKKTKAHGNLQLSSSVSVQIIRFYSLFYGFFKVI